MQEKQLPYFGLPLYDWKLVNNAVIPIWISQSEALKACKELIKCTWLEKCGLRCQSKKLELPCTELCKCGGGYG